MSSEPIRDTEKAIDFDTDPDKGLSKEEVGRRHAIYGTNEIPEEKRHTLRDFLKRFWGLTAWMLELTMVISLALDKVFQFYLIMALLLFNAILGFLQESQATAAVKGLISRLQVQARVLRDSVWTRVPARELVPGDVIRLRAGDFVPADIRIVEGDVEVDQSAVTGESLPAPKQTGDKAFSGSMVRRGECCAVVQAIGASTFFGKTTELVQTAKPKLHMEEVTQGVVRWLLIIVISLLGVAFLTSLLRGVDLLEMLPLALVLLTSAIPVALPTMFVISMALGSVELAKKGVLITRLSAVEDAATMDTLCVDKTGTITLNKLAVTAIDPMPGFTEADIALYGGLASHEADQDPIDNAFIASAQHLAPSYSSYTQTHFVPFDPETKRTEATSEGCGKRLSTMKGAVETLAHLCAVPEEVLARLETRMDGFAKSGYRTLGVAVSEDGMRPVFAGLVALWDPPRRDSAQLIKSLGELGVSVKMLTGDAVPVAQEMARKVGLGSEIVSASELRDMTRDGMAKAGEIAETSSGFAQIFPEDKYIIVKSLQARKHVVGMTGDGLNDAPALRQAEVGIAVSNATDVAKGSASVVLTDEGLTEIVDLVGLGRRIYQRITIWTLNKIIKTFEVVVFASLALILTGVTVIGAFQVVLLLLVNDFVTISLSTDKVRWSRKPETWNISNLVKVAVVLGILMVIEHFILLYIALRYLGLGSNIPLMNTFAFGMLFYSGMFTVLLVRERRHFWNSAPSKPLGIAIFSDIILVVALSTFGIPGLTPIPFVYTLGIIGYYLFSVLVVNDALKHVLVKRAGMSW